MERVLGTCCMSADDGRRTELNQTTSVSVSGAVVVFQALGTSQPSAHRQSYHEILRVADSFLATNDIDYYMDMRAVCRSWCDVMADPSRCAADAYLLCRRQWIMLGDYSEDEHRLFLNVSTGRFLRRRLPLLRDHDVVDNSDGLVILGENKNPHAGCVLNPLTGTLIRFAVPICAEKTLIGAVTGSNPMMALYMFVNGDKILRCADPTSKFFPVQVSQLGRRYKIQSMVSYAGHVYAADMAGSVFKIVGTAQRCYGELVAKIPGEPTMYLVESTGDPLLICNSDGGLFEIFWVDVERKVLEAVKGIGSRTLFLGPSSVSVDANKLPSIDGDCLYYNG